MGSPIDNAGRDKQVLDEFVRALAGFTGKEITIEAYPDEDEQAIAAVDAIAGEFAIEHTKIGISACYWHRTDLHKKFRTRVLAKLTTKLACQLSLALPASEALEQRALVADDLADWIETNVPGLPNTETDAVNPLTICGRNAFYSKSPSEHPGLTLRYLAEPNADDYAKFRKQLGKKVAKLRKCMKHSPVLLLESADIVNMSETFAKDLVEQCLSDEERDGIEVWFADTSATPSYFYRLFPDCAKMKEPS